MELPTIPQFYANQTIFITGGSGFIGKVLTEKLLRSCPDLKKIYLLLREKNGESLEDRVKTITDLPLFDLVKSQNQESLTKIAMVKGDVKKINLGLTHEDQTKLIREVNVVFHTAASFDDSLTDAVLLNTRGTREVVKLALEMKNIQVLVHISTTYCNSDQKTVEERLYPPRGDWKNAIEFAEKLDKQILNMFAAKYIEPSPNTYTFTKALAEHVVYDMCNGKIPFVIYRPSLVGCTSVEPFPGWVDNHHGLMGLVIASTKGVLRTLYGGLDKSIHFLPVDVAVKAIIIASWKQASNKNLSPTFYNGVSDVYNMKISKVLSLTNALTQQVPSTGMLWYPSTITTKHYCYYFIRFLMCDFFLCAFFDTMLRLFGGKSMLLRIRKQIHLENMDFSYFLLNESNYVGKNYADLQKSLLPSDDTFFYEDNTFDPLEYFKQGILMGRRILLNEKRDVEKGKQLLFKWKVLSKICNFSMYSMVIWFIYVKFCSLTFSQ